MNETNTNGIDEVVVVITKEKSPKNRVKNKEVRTFPNRDSADEWIESYSDTLSEHEKFHTSHETHIADYITDSE